MPLWRAILMVEFQSSGGPIGSDILDAQMQFPCGHGVPPCRFHREAWRECAGEAMGLAAQSSLVFRSLVSGALQNRPVYRAPKRVAGVGLRSGVGHTFYASGVGCTLTAHCLAVIFLFVFEFLSWSHRPPRDSTIATMFFWTNIVFLVVAAQGLALAAMIN